MLDYVRVIHFRIIIIIIIILSLFHFYDASNSLTFESWALLIVILKSVIVIMATWCRSLANVMLYYIVLVLVVYIFWNLLEYNKFPIIY